MKHPSLREFTNIAVIQTAFLGDVALCLYLPELIKFYHPTCKITFVTTPAASSLAACSKAIDSIITYDKRNMHKGLKGIKFVAESLKMKNIECIISPHRSLRSTLVTYYTKPQFSVTFNKSAASFLYSARVRYQKVHEIKRNASLLSVFTGIEGLDKICPKVELELSADDLSYIDYKLREMNVSTKERIVCIAPGSVWETKRWLEQNFIELAGLFAAHGFKCILIGSKDDKELCQNIAVKSGAVDLSGETSIPQTLCLLKNADLLVTNDSSPTHFAGLVQCPTLTIYGPTVPEFGFAPVGEKTRVIEPKELKCRPCAIHGGHKCPQKTFDCMHSITPEQVFKASREILIAG